MKKAFLVLLALVLMVSMVACGGAQSSKASSSQASSVASIEDVPSEVTIEVPVSWFALDGRNIEEVAQEFVTIQQEGEGTISVTLNNDGSVTLIVSGTRYQAMLDDTRNFVTAFAGDIMAEENYASIVDIAYTDDFSEFVFSVETEGWLNGFDGAAVFQLGYMAYYYRVLLGSSVLAITFQIVNAETGEAIGTTVYPDDLDR